MANLQHGHGHAARALPPAAPPEVLSCFELSKGESLYRRGDADAGLYRVEAGLLKLCLPVAGGRERILGLAGPGDVLGTLDPAAGRCCEDAEALSSSVRVSLLDGRADAAAGLRLQALLSQAEHLRSTLEDAELPVPLRLARAMLRLGQRFGQQQSDGLVRLTLPLTHDHLAAMIGAARETTSFELARLRRGRLLAGTRGVYTFRPELLSDFAAPNSP